jgi:cytochrome c biogenesis protein CcmG/thiol:disulfide interchange protein DsbE
VKPSRTAIVSAVALAVVLAVLIAVLATSKSADQRHTSSPLLGKAAPELTGAIITGTAGADPQTFDLVDAGGRWVLVNFFATWCVPCVREHPDLVRFAAAHAATGDAIVISVVFDDKPENVRAYFDQRGGDWTVVSDKDGAIATRWGVAGVPESYLVAPDGTVVSKITGGVEYAKLEDLLARAEQVG